MRMARLTMPLGSRATSCAAIMRPTPGVRRRSRYPATSEHYPGRTASRERTDAATRRDTPKGVLHRKSDVGGRPYRAACGRIREQGAQAAGTCGSDARSGAREPWKDPWTTCVVTMESGGQLHGCNYYP